MFDDRVITDFADRLVPEAFARHHTAHRVDVVAERPRGADGFARWIDARIGEALADRYAWGGRPLRYAIVEAADRTRWRWDGSPCEERDWFVGRVRREARELVQPWVFAVELPWPEPVWEHYDPEVDDYVELDEPIVDLRWTATWYAEARGGGAAATTAGCLDLYGEEVAAERTVSPRAGTAGLFHRILYGHPDRKRFPLR